MFYKIRYIDAELAGMHINLMWNCRDVRVAFLFAMCMLVKLYHLGVNWPTTLCENKAGVHFFTLSF